ncbi:hypothetical protein [Pseudoruegeria sp. HB172150]|uniref:hypothetical protein n=1 Tax=Pseudoruegeria sp. HB172150 TaxID=2721164 RepID=UPI0015575194|nr:hypothetical protein [Pseudoruegeria sp. HB172150]
MIARLLFVAAALLLAACSGTPDPSAPSGGTIRPDASGLAIEGSPLRIDFGRTRDSTLAAVTRLMGAAPSSQVSNPECGAGPTLIVEYDGLDLLFQQDAFRGWVADGAGIVTANGLRPGTTRTALEASGAGPFEATTLGVEFETGGVFGLLPDGTQDAELQLLWAGTSCFFR